MAIRSESIPEQYDRLVAGLLTRAMREQGFIGDVAVADIRTGKRGIVARVTATVGTTRAVYRGRIAGGKVTLKQVSNPERVTV